MNTFVRPSSGFDFSDASTPRDNLREQHPDLNESSVSGAALQRNKTERKRLQGLQKTISTVHKIRAAEPKTLQERFKVWLINEGGKELFFGVWIFLHLLVAVFGFVNYQLKDDFNNARAQFGITFSQQFHLSLTFFSNLNLSFSAIARAAALVLHIDVIFILLPVCRNFISLLRRTPLNGIIPFDCNITLHKATGWSIVAGTVIHILSHMVNFYKLAGSVSSTPTEHFLNFIAVNFTTGPGATGWIMTIILGIMTYFASEKQRKINFERFWYSHHLFMIFFISWQLHGMFCMIKPDRPPYCSYNNVGVFWVCHRLSSTPLSYMTLSAILACWGCHLDH